MIKTGRLRSMHKTNLAKYARIRTDDGRELYRFRTRPPFAVVTIDRPASYYDSVFEFQNFIENGDVAEFQNKG